MKLSFIYQYPAPRGSGEKQESVIPCRDRIIVDIPAYPAGALDRILAGFDREIDPGHQDPIVEIFYDANSGRHIARGIQAINMPSHVIDFIYANARPEGSGNGQNHAALVHSKLQRGAIARSPSGYPSPGAYRKNIQPATDYADRNAVITDFKNRMSRLVLVDGIVSTFIETPCFTLSPPSEQSPASIFLVAQPEGMGLLNDAHKVPVSNRDALIQQARDLDWPLTEPLFEYETYPLRQGHYHQLVKL